MKFDLLYEIDVPKPWAGSHPWGQRAGEKKAYDEALEQIKLADRLGFNTVWCVEHHFRENRSHMPCSEAVLGAISQITENLRLGFGVTLMPHAFIHPARVAEKVATVDLLSNGRVEWGTGRSTPMEQGAFHVDRARSKEQWRAAVKTVVGMWEQEYYEEHSEFLDFPRRMVTPKPLQVPHPPAWVACTSPGSAEVAGEAGMGMLSLSILQPLKALADQIRAYRGGHPKARPLTSVTNNKVAAYTLVHCVEDRRKLDTNKVWESLWWWYKGLSEFTLQWEFPEISEAERAQIFPHLFNGSEQDLRFFDDEDMIIIGTPDECVQKLKRYQEIGVDQVICYVQFGYIPHEATLESLRLLGEHVIPQFKTGRVVPAMTLA